MGSANSDAEQRPPRVHQHDAKADEGSGGAPETPETTDENGRPVDNPSG